MSVSPFLRIPLTDLTGCLTNQQTNGRCADMEIKMMECLEAYGMTRGRVKCEAIIEDFRECTSRQKQFDRIVAMRAERHLQYVKKEREGHYAEAPKVDSF